MKRFVVRRRVSISGVEDAGSVMPQWPVMTSRGWIQRMGSGGGVSGLGLAVGHEPPGCSPRAFREAHGELSPMAEE